MIPIYSAVDIKRIEQATMIHEQISSLELMEKAARAFVSRFVKLDLGFKDVLIFCGFGNNGGDGLAISRLLHKKGFNVEVFILQNHEYSVDRQANYERFLTLPITSHLITDRDDIPALENYPPNKIIIDALWGYGLNRPLEGVGAELVYRLNQIEGIKIAVDIPSGLLADLPIIGVHFIADITITFEWFKQIMFWPAESEACGQIIATAIGLDDTNDIDIMPEAYEISIEDVSSILRPRLAFSHKNNFGHVTLIAGSLNMGGAAALCTRSCVIGGAGLTTTLTCATVRQTILQHVPEAMTYVYGDEYIDQIKLPASTTVIGAGPGIGKALLTGLALKHALSQFHHLHWILDADALNLVAENNWHNLIPAESILTPHEGEFDRLFGIHEHLYNRIETAKIQCERLQCYIILKGHYSAIITPHGQVYYNTTGNPGLAKGGSGDVLTGLLCGLRAQKYNALETAIMGVYLHGEAADSAADELTEYCVTASDVINHLPYAFKALI